MDAVADGPILALDADEPFVRLIERDGSSVRGSVRQGQGPGEVEQPRLAFRTANGGFAVLDYFRALLLLYDGSGTFLRADSLDLGRVIAGDYDAGTKRLLVLHAPVLPPGAPFALAEVDIGDRGIAIGQRQLGEYSGPERSHFMSYAWDAASGRVAVGSGEEYRVTVQRTDGEVGFEIVRRVAARTRTPEEIERRRAYLRRNVGDDVRAESSDGANHRYFYFDAMDYSPRGFLWVLTSQDPGGGRIFEVFDVFDSRGTYVASAVIDTPVKSSCSCFAVTEDLLIAVTTDAGGVDRVAAWGIPDRLR